jgi:ankyrin repeat protein
MGSSGFNCLHAACGSGNIEMTEYLLFKRKVNPNILGKDGWSPLEIAVQTGVIEIVQLLLKDKRINLK